MALTANDPVMFYSQQVPINAVPPRKGTVIAAPPNPSIAWDGAGAVITYTAIAAPTGVARLAIAGAGAADILSWTGALVEPDPNTAAPIANPNGRLRGVVVDVVNVLEPVAVPVMLVIKCPDGYYCMAAPLVRRVT